MNRITLTAWLVLFFAVTASAQTNSAEACHSLFLVPGSHLRDLPSDAQSPGRAVSPDKVVSAGQAIPDDSAGAMDERLRAVRMSVSTGMDRFDLDLLHKLEQDGSFIRQPGPPTGLAKFADSVFRPEVISLGKAKFTCTLITAIKRKNPLCLLNPYFLNFSW
jgi:hypothetical protein